MKGVAVRTKARLVQPEDKEITGKDGHARPEGKPLPHPFLQNDGRKDYGKYGLQFLQEHNHRQVLEIHQEQRFYNGSSSDKSPECSDQKKVCCILEVEPGQLFVFPGEKEIHDDEGEEVQDKNHENYIQVEKPRGQHDAVKSPHDGGHAYSDASYYFLVLFHHAGFGKTITGFTSMEFRAVKGPSTDKIQIQFGQRNTGFP